MRTRAEAGSKTAAVVVPLRAASTAAGFLLDAVSVPLSLDPAAFGAYRTVTLQCFFGPRLVAVQVSAVFENADPGKDTVSAPAAEPPVFFNTKVCDAVVPASIVPKFFDAGVNAIHGAPPPVAAATPSLRTNAA